MKYFNKTLVSLLALCAFTFSFTSCDNDDDNVVGSEIPDFELASEQMRVKIGTENKQAIDVESGAGEYAAYSLDETIAQVVEEDGQVFIEGLRNGQTTIIVSDAGSRYRRIAVSVYTTEVLTLSETSFNLEAPLGFNATAEASVVLGNGEYTIESDNAAVTASIDAETGEITINGRGRLEEYTAVVTVTDCTGISATIEVTVVGSTTPFTADDLDAIKANNTVGITFDNGRDDLYNYGTNVAAVQSNGKMRVGITFYSYYYTYVEYNGDLTVGTKTDGTFSANYSWRYSQQACDVEVIQNTGSRIWIIFSWVDMENETLHRGYIIQNI
ncbi:MAG: cadherin repeat domain-containing protein [Alloprevotella sp.]|nr:cadherin repeat domain-containing protein [Alloprevotella sp.]